jgi:hypothetical protein
MFMIFGTSPFEGVRTKLTANDVRYRSECRKWTYEHSGSRGNPGGYSLKQTLPSFD